MLEKKLFFIYYLCCGSFYLFISGISNIKYYDYCITHAEFWLFFLALAVLSFMPSGTLAARYMRRLW